MKFDLKETLDRAQFSLLSWELSFFFQGEAWVHFPEQLLLVELNFDWLGLIWTFFSIEYM